MGFDFLSQAARFLQERKAYKRWLAVFLSLALVVTSGTFAMLKMYGQAMTHQVKVLDCQYEVHVHTEECYEEDEEGNQVLVCEHADEAEYVIHIHNDDCYDQKGNLVCPLQEHEPHEHTEDCWEEEEVLICEEEETEGGTEDEAEDVSAESADTAKAERKSEADSRDAEKGSDAETEKELACEKEEHTHDDSCYEGGTGCEKEEHEHGDGCYEKTSTLICETETHEHDDSCYETIKELACGLGEHEHDSGCYDEDDNLVCEEEEHTHDDGCYTTSQGELACGLETHEHGEDCYEVTETLTCEKEEHTHDDSCDAERELICETEEHEHDDSCYVETESEEEAESEAVEEAEAEETAAKEATGDSEEAEEGHTHTEECYETEEVLACGELELHTHEKALVEDGGCYDESAFDEDGEFIEGSRPVCGLLQLEEHVHTEGCFKIVELTPEEIAALENGAELHIHTEDCYDEEGNLICGHDATHLHVPECYDDSGKLICGYGTASHVHENSCYDEEGNLICGYETASHVHEDSCYDAEGNRICGYETATHEHDDSCYDAEGNLICGYETAVHEHDAGCYDGEGNLVCGYEDAKDHEHDSNCYDGNGRLICGYAGVKNHEHAADCYDIMGNLICGYEGVEAHVHTDSCYDENGNLICGYEVLEAYDAQKVYENENYIVVVRYNSDAEIPEEAELIAEEITPDSDEEHYGNRETEYRKMMEDTTASMRALLKIGFYLEGEEVEPATPVAVSIQFLDEDGLEEGRPITVIHFAEESTEKLDGSVAKGNRTSFKMDSFSEIAIGYKPEKDNKIFLSDSFEYENDEFHITFHIEGEAMIEENEIVETANDNSLTNDEEDKDEIDSKEGIDLPENKKEIDEQNEALIDADEDGAENKLELNVESLDENSKEYEEISAYAEEVGTENDLLLFRALTYSLTYDGIKLNLSNCQVTAEVIPTESLVKYAEEATPSVMALSNDNEISEKEQTIMLTSVEVSGSTFGEAFDSVSEEVPKDVTEETSESTYANPLTSMPLKTSAKEGMVVSLSNDTIGLVILSSQANPNFTVQFYANLPRMTNEGGAASLGIINTSASDNNGKATLPENGTGTDIKNAKAFYVDGDDKSTTKRNVVTKLTPTRVYSEKECQYILKPSLDYFNGLYENDNYHLYQIWVLKDEKNPESIVEGDWNIYKDPSVMHFTNRPKTAEENENYILIKDNTVIRLLYSVTGEKYKNDVMFYDYDITTGGIYDSSMNQNDKKPTSSQTDGKWWAWAYKRGINSDSNYSEGANDGNKFAFGNANTGSGLDKATYNGYFMNQANRKDTVKFCTFGLVKKELNADGTLAYSDGVYAPNLFNDGSAAGKTEISGSQLVFNRVGDTYTLTAVEGENASASELEKFNHPYSTKLHDTIWTNNFWPMDHSNTWGTDGHDMKYGRVDLVENRRFFYRENSNDNTSTIIENKTFPVGDDGQDHNCNFGMHYEVDFELMEEYVGPLEYYFFGDDDMWVYLSPIGEDGKPKYEESELVCDIGGVHSSVGEYVDLWDYLESSNSDKRGGVKGKYRLSFFYTERGESGSTCWMQFTLPSVTSVTPKQTVGELRIEKEVTGAETTDEEFGFTVEFQDEDGNQLKNDYAYTKYEYYYENGIQKTREVGNDILVWNGARFTLKANQYVVINFLPDGTKYTITEAGPVKVTTSNGKPQVDEDGVLIWTEQEDPYVPVISGDGTTTDESGQVKGTISSSQFVMVKYNNVYSFQLPKTGGPGLTSYTIAGALLVMFSAGLMYRKKFRGRRV